jgi:hypothetical protein
VLLGGEGRWFVTACEDPTAAVYRPAVSLGAGQLQFGAVRGRDGERQTDARTDLEVGRVRAVITSVPQAIRSSNRFEAGVRGQSVRRSRAMNRPLGARWSAQVRA